VRRLRWRARQWDSGAQVPDVPSPLHDADHDPADPVGQHGHLGGARRGVRLRAARDGCDEAHSACGRPRAAHRFRHLARGLRRAGAARLHAVGVLLDEGAGFRRAGAHDGRRRHHLRPVLLHAQQPLPRRQLGVDQGPPRKQVPANGDRRGGGAAIDVHLPAAAATHLRQRAGAVACVALAAGRQAAVLLRRRGREEARTVGRHRARSMSGHQRRIAARWRQAMLPSPAAYRAPAIISRP